MLIQLKNGFFVNPEQIILMPAAGSRDREEREPVYEVCTAAEARFITSITAPEVEVLLLLAGKGPDESHPVLRTDEWGVVDGSLNYRYGKVLEKAFAGGAFAGGGTFVEDYLRSLAKGAVEGNGNATAVLNMLADLARDREYVFNDRELLRKTLFLRNAESQKTILKKILESWCDIFIDLPF